MGGMAVQVLQHLQADLADLPLGAAVAPDMKHMAPLPEVGGNDQLRGAGIGKDKPGILILQPLVLPLLVHRPDYQIIIIQNYY